MTGGATGLGAATVSLLAERGWAVTATTHATLPAVGLPAHLVACDLARPAAVDSLVERLEPGPDVVVHCATRFHRRPLGRVTTAELTGDLAVGLAGIDRLLRHLVARADGRLRRVVLVGSAGALHGASGLTAYGATKAGVRGYGQALARELRGGTTVNVVEPGPMATPLAERQAAAWRADATRAARTVVPADPRQVAAVVGFLVGDGAANISGAVLRVDGGLLAGAAP